MMDIIKAMLRNTSLSIKMILFTVLLGTMIWLILNHIQTNQLNSLFHSRLSERLAWESEYDRYRFDHSIKSLYRSARLLSNYEPLQRYANGLRAWRHTDQILNHRRIPSWLPAVSILRDMVPFHHVVLIDSGLHVREAFSSTNAPLPEPLRQPSRLLLELSKQQTYLTMIDNNPYLLASTEIAKPRQTGQGNILLIATPITTAFLQHAQGGTSHGNIIAILSANNDEVLVSSRPDTIPAGMPVADLRDAYLVTNTAFFDYGASDILIRFVSLTPTEEVQLLTRSMALRGMIAAIAFMIPFTLIVYRITHRIESLNLRINTFIRGMRLDIEDSNNGDQINRLESKFIALSEQVIRETGLLEYQALHDGLTGLPNRKLFHDRFDISLNEAIRSHHGLAVMIIDLNKFKEINDSLGHYIGDEVLKIAASRFANEVRISDTISRYGGDEFAILLPNIDRTRAVEVAKSLVKALDNPIQTSGFSLDIGASIGIAMYPQDARDKHSLLQYADHAMYDAKRNQLGYRFYEPKAPDSAHDHLG